MTKDTEPKPIKDAKLEEVQGGITLDNGIKRTGNITLDNGIKLRSDVDSSLVMGKGPIPSISDDDV